MKTLRQLSVALVFVFAFTTPSFAGEIQIPIAPPPPTLAGEIQTTSVGQIDTTANGDIETGLSLIQSLLSLL
jgi:hypothetical protein